MSAAAHFRLCAEVHRLGWAWLIGYVRTRLKAHPQADQDICAEGRKAAHLRIALVQEVLHPEDEIETLHPVVLLEHAVRATQVHTGRAAVVDLADELPLLADHVDLGPE